MNIQGTTHRVSMEGSLFGPPLFVQGVGLGVNRSTRHPATHQHAEFSKEFGAGDPT